MYNIEKTIQDSISVKKGILESCISEIKDATSLMFNAIKKSKKDLMVWQWWLCSRRSTHVS